MRLSAVIAVLLLLPVMGCSPKGSQVDPQTRRLTAVDDAPDVWPAWFPQASGVRVHPASRYVIEEVKGGGRALVPEVRIELLDQFGEPIKDVGQLTIEMQLLDANGGKLKDKRGLERRYRHSFDLTKEEAQREYWDPIARAYRFHLTIHPEDADFPDFRTAVAVTFESAWPGGKKLTLGRDEEAVEIRADW